MGKKIDMVGKKIGRWLVIKETKNRTSNGSVKFLCKCDCGKYKEVNGALLRNGQSTSCGCYNREIITNPNRIRGTKLYGVYNSMKQRCYNENDKAYKNYGKRGIKVCNEWLETGYNFIKWAKENGYKEGLWLDRIDNNKDYTPDNCRWASPKEQQNNKRTNHLFTYKGETHTIKEWSIIKNINYGTLMQRVNENKEPFAPIDITKRHNIKTKKDQ